MLKKEGRLGKKQEQNLFRNTRYARYSTSRKPREDPDSSEKLQEIERRYVELGKRFTGKHEATAHDESEILERQHTMKTAAATHEESEILERQHTTTTSAAANDEAEILGQQHATRATAAAKHVAVRLGQKHAATAGAIANEGAEMLEQHTAVTVARKEETIDSKDQELSALIERRTLWTKDKAQVKEISKKIQ